MRNVLFTAPLFIGSMLFSGGFSQSPGNEGAASGGVPLSLSVAIQTGLDNNPEVKSAIEKVKAARGRRLSAVSPSPAELSVTNDDVPKGEPLRSFGERTVGVSQTFEFPANYFFRGSKYSIEKKIAETGLEQVKLGVVLNIKKAYFTVCALQSRAAIAEENVAIAEDFMRKAEIRHSVGEGANLEKLTARVSVTGALNGRAVIKSQLAAARTELNYRMGYGRGELTTYHPVDSLCYTRYHVTLDNLLGTALAVHPLLKENKLLVNSSRIDKTLALTGILPEFNIGLFNKQVSGDATRYYGASFSLGVPVWFMLDQRGKLLEASSGEAAAQADLKAVDNAIFSRTSAAFTEFEHAENQVRLYLDEMLPQAEAIYRVAVKSYEAGEISYIEFLQAQQTLINSKNGHTEALLSYNLAIVALEEAVGTTLK